MYDDHYEQFERHFDFFRDHDDYQAYMKGEDGTEGALPVDCGPSEEKGFLVAFENDDLFSSLDFNNERDS